MPRRKSSKPPAKPAPRKAGRPVGKDGRVGRPTAIRLTPRDDAALARVADWLAERGLAAKTPDAIRYALHRLDREISGTGGSVPAA